MSRRSYNGMDHRPRTSSTVWTPVYSGKLYLQKSGALYEREGEIQLKKPLRVYGHLLEWNTLRHVGALHTVVY